MSRFKPIILCALLLSTALPAGQAFAQMGGGGGGGDADAEKSEAARKKRESEWGNARAPLPQLRSSTPLARSRGRRGCPRPRCRPAGTSAGT